VRQSRAQLHGRCTAGAHHDNGEPEVCTEATSDLGRVAAVRAGGLRQQVCLEAHGKPLLDEGATRAQLAEGGYGHRLDERLFGAAPVHDLLLEDVDERAVSSLLLGAGRLDGARWEVLHLGDARLQSFQGALALRLSRGLGEGVRNGGVKEEFLGGVTSDQNKTFY